MTETEKYLTHIKENPSPLVDIVTTVNTLVEQNAEQVGCIVDDNGFYNRITSLTEFSSEDQGYTLQVSLMRENESRKLTHSVDLFLSKEMLKGAVYRVDVEFGVEEKLKRLMHSVEESLVLLEDRDIFLMSYSFLDKETLVDISDNWAECRLSREEVMSVLSNAQDFRIPRSLQIQGTFQQLQEYLSQQSEEGMTSPLLLSSRMLE